MQATIRIKGYDGVEQLALGKRTVVFAGNSRKHRVPVVIKVLLPHLVGDPRFLARFTHDVGVAGQLRHHNLVNILEHGRSETTYYLVVERYQGTPLGEILAEHPRLPAPVALSIVMQVGQALEAAHARGLVHRDVRPANIVLTDDGVVKLANLGLATDIGEQGRVTHAGKVTATPAYMSPEQTRGGDLTGRSDIFSLGAVAYELLAGVRAFGKGDFGAIVDRIQSGQRTPFSAANPVIEGTIVRLIERMLATDASERCEHISEVLMDLEEAIEKYAHGCSPDELAAYLIDPVGVTDHYVESVLGRITAKAPPREGASRSALLSYYEKVSFLDPGDEGASRELARLRREQGSTGRTANTHARSGPAWNEDSPAFRFADLDPAADYRVILESINRAMENEASFALKLSLKLNTPLPRIKSLVRSMPSRVSDRLSYKRALQLARAIEELGGRARLDVCPLDKGDAGPKNAAPTAPPGATACPKCGNVEEPEASFCSICLHRFSSAKLDARTLRECASASDNPLSEAPQKQSRAAHLREIVRGCPMPFKVILGAVLAIALLQALIR